MIEFDSLFSFTLDGESLLAIIITIIWLYYLERSYDLFDRFAEIYNKSDPVKKVTIGPLLFIGFISLWMTIRFAGRHFYLFSTGDVYLTESILNMLAWLLTTNLCLTLFTAFTLPTNSNGEDGNGNSANISGLLSVARQAIIIGIITFLPRSSSLKLHDPDNTFNTISYVLILLSFIISYGILTRMAENS